ncbi:MAG: TetR/AcrR family transcriptional regulator, partial [Spirochaetia bacterium]
KGKILDEATSKRIKEAARGVFLSKGYDGATMQAIADVSKVNKALLHYYYRSKDKLFLLIFKEELQRFSQPSFDDLQDSSKELAERLETLIAHVIRLITKIPELPLFLMNEFQRNPDLIQGLLNELKIPAMTRHVRRLIKRGAESCHDISIDELLITIFSLLFFPVMSAPMFQSLLELSPKRWAEIQRKQAILAKEMIKKYVG